jgi:hypothetical protein
MPRRHGAHSHSQVFHFEANGGTDSFVAESLAQLDELDVRNLLCLPGESDAGVLEGALEYAVVKRAMLLVDPPSAD